MNNRIGKKALAASTLVLGFLLPALRADAAVYEAKLPEQLFTDPDLCAYAPCREVVPGADSFSKRKGSPPYVEAYRTQGGQKKLAGYAFLSTDLTDTPGYSGKPIVTLIGMDTAGTMTGVKILKHSEPILLVGIPEPKLLAFVQQYVGKFAGDRFEVGRAAKDEGFVGLDAVSGATVTVISENQVISRSAYEIAREVGIVKSRPRPQAKFTPIAETLDWEALRKEGSVQRLTVLPKDVGVKDNGQPYLDLYFGYLNVPTIGRSILGDEDYRRLMAGLKQGSHAIFIITNGTGSFKGSGFVRGGIFDRFQVKQGMDSFTFRDVDYQNLYGIHAAGAPGYRESGIFILRDPHFSAAYPWRLVLLANKLDKETGKKTFVNFDREYWLPARYLEGGRPRVERLQPAWLRVWKAKRFEIAAFILLLAATATIYSLRDKLTRRASHKDKRWVAVPKRFIQVTSLGFVGFYALAQPSVTQVLTWFHSLLYQWKWELFLSDPFIFIFWWFIIVTVFVWGRGLFCGWLCPYGALTELAFRTARVLGLRRFQVRPPQWLHDRLKWVKYGVFAALLAGSFYSMGMAEKMAEVEPFKTTFLVGVWSRSWPFVLYWSLLFAVALFIERPFCKYLCPLGAGLAIPSTFRFFGLRRKAECRTCRACGNGCSSLAIDERGNIDQRECLLCLDCMILYYDERACPPLAQERKRREKAALPITPIGADGYFIPVSEIKRKKVVNER